MRKQLIVNLYGNSTLDLNWHFIHYFKNLNKVAYLTILLNQYSKDYQNKNLVDGSFFLIYEDVQQLLPLSLKILRKLKKELIADDIIEVKMKGAPAKEYIFLNFKKISKILLGRF